MKRIRVSAAVIHIGNKVLAAQRGYGPYKGGWEFPGGKQEEGESAEEAIVREIKEELELDIKVEDYLTTVEYDYPEFHLTMDSYVASPLSEHMNPLEHSALKWVAIEELGSINWLPADIPVADMAIQYFKEKEKSLNICYNRGPGDYTMDNNRFLRAASHFNLEGEPQSCKPIGSGHINETFIIKDTTGKKYILQKLNSIAFKNVAGLMDNIIKVTSYLKSSESDPRKVLNYRATADGQYYFEEQETGDYWRLYDFVEGICLNKAENIKDFYQSAIAFGDFQNKLNHFPADELIETIPGFHNTIQRYEHFESAISEDVMHRANSVSDDIAFALDRKSEAGTLLNLQKEGILPTRVTHNDTKLNNVLLDEETLEPLCVIDLDTVMPGLSAYDFGDAIRFGASTAEEDELDLDKMTIDLDYFKAFTEGYIKAFPSLTDDEILYLPEGCKIITLELGVRFLTDYLKGDVYFHIARENHNLDRCRTQFRLVEEMEKKWDEMKAIVKEAKSISR